MPALLELTFHETGDRELYFSESNKMPIVAGIVMNFAVPHSRIRDAERKGGS